MKMLRLLSILSVLFFGILTLEAQSPVAQEGMKDFEKKSQGNAISITIQGQPKNVNAVLADMFKKETGKGRMIKLSKMQKFEGVIFPTISSSTLDYYYKVDKAAKNDDSHSTVTFFISEGNNNFLSSDKNPDAVYSAMDLLEELEWEVKKYELDLAIDNQQKLIEKESKNHQNLVQDSVNLEQKLVETIEAIEQNKIDRTNQLITIDEENIRLEDLQYEMELTKRGPNFMYTSEFDRAIEIREIRRKEEAERARSIRTEAEFQAAERANQLYQMRRDLNNPPSTLRRDIDEDAELQRKSINIPAENRKTLEYEERREDSYYDDIRYRGQEADYRRQRDRSASYENGNRYEQTDRYRELPNDYYNEESARRAYQDYNDERYRIDSKYRNEGLKEQDRYYPSNDYRDRKEQDKYYNDRYREDRYRDSRYRGEERYREDSDKYVEDRYQNRDDESRYRNDPYYKDNYRDSSNDQYRDEGYEVREYNNREPRYQNPENEEEYRRYQYERYKEDEKRYREENEKYKEDREKYLDDRKYRENEKYQEKPQEKEKDPND